MEKNNSFSYKDFFIKYGIFLAIIAVLFLILFYSVFFTRKSWQKNLKNTIETVLDENESNAWLIGKSKKINNPFCLNAACYEANYRKTGESYLIVILRIQSFYGPVSAIFSVDKNDNVNFISYSSLHGRVATQLYSDKSDKRLEYWKQKIPEILGSKGGKK